MKRNFATLAVSTIFATTVLAQNAPFAQGPSHPMSAPLSPSSPYAKVDPQLFNVHPATPTVLNRPVVNNMATGYDLVRKVEDVTEASNAPARNGTLMPGHDGSVDAFGSEPVKGAARGGVYDPLTIFGADERVVVGNASTYPWRANAELIITFKDNTKVQGSCTMVAGKYALTAGHCVYDGAHGGWAKSIQVMPGRSGGYLPYGSAWVTYMRSYTGWTASGNNQYDIALITLDRNIGLTTGWFGYGWWSSLAGVTGYLSAYDADRSPNYQKYRYGVMSEQPLTVSYVFDTFPGCSGGGVYRVLSGTRYCVGVNNWQYSNRNQGVRITAQRFNDISNWIASGS